MPVQPTFMLIADIGGYTRFMKMQRTSLAHAHDIIARLLESVIDAARGLTLAKLEGDAAFFYVGFRAGSEPNLDFVADQIASIYRAFHERAQRMVAANHCKCGACEQIANLKIKFASHFGEAAVHRVKRMTELAGVDVILVHRLLKNTVPVPEYLLMTQPVLERLNGDLRDRSSPHPMNIEDLGALDTYFVDLPQYVGQVPSQPRRTLAVRLALALGLLARTMPHMVGLRQPCEGYRNMPSDAKAHSTASI